MDEPTGAAGFRILRQWDVNVTLGMDRRREKEDKLALENVCGDNETLAPVKANISGTQPTSLPALERSWLIIST